MFNSQAIPCDDQPISAGIMHENRFLSSWITPDSLEVQETYKELTEGISDPRERIYAVWRYVTDIPYTPYINSRVQIDGKVIKQDDVWLDPAQALSFGCSLNCFNKSVLLASLLRQDLSPDQVYVSLNNVTYDGIGGHAVVYLPNGDYILESTNPKITSPFMRASDVDMYEAVIFFNDNQVSAVPSAKLKEPLGLCCVEWLSSYCNHHLCDCYI